MGLTGRLGVLPAGDDDRVSRRKAGRARRPLLVAGFVLACLAAGGVMLALGDRVAGGELAVPALGVLKGDQQRYRGLGRAVRGRAAVSRLGG